MEPVQYEVLSEQDVQRLVQALARGQEVWTEADADLVIEFAHRAFVAAAMVRAALHGRLFFTVHEGSAHIMIPPAQSFETLGMILSEYF